MQGILLPLAGIPNPGQLLRLGGVCAGGKLGESWSEGLCTACPGQGWAPQLKHIPREEHQWVGMAWGGRKDKNKFCSWDDLIQRSLIQNTHRAAKSFGQGIVLHSGGYTDKIAGSEGLCSLTAKCLNNLISSRVGQVTYKNYLFFFKIKILMLEVCLHPLMGTQTFLQIQP